ncbi:MAG: hypothetical protein ACMG6E_03945 [Candidatus Roizmanbacteria bacterium]
MNMKYLGLDNNFNNIDKTKMLSLHRFVSTCNYVLTNTDIEQHEVKEVYSLHIL